MRNSDGQRLVDHHFDHRTALLLRPRRPGSAGGDHGEKLLDDPGQGRGRKVCQAELQEAAEVQHRLAFPLHEDAARCLFHHARGFSASLRHEVAQMLCQGRLHPFARPLREVVVVLQELGHSDLRRLADLGPRIVEVRRQRMQQLHHLRRRPAAGRRLLCGQNAPQKRQTPAHGRCRALFSIVDCLFR
eukprot:scaffold71_cov247-Pinguiococcus_pyrenoidosus.AAC.2